MDSSNTTQTSRLPWFKRPVALLMGGAGVIMMVVLALFWPRASGEQALTAVVTRGALRMQLTVSGVLAPAQSLGYRSPLGGREAEVMSLAPEGTHVGEGDLLVRLDTTELERELERTIQERRGAEVDLQVAEIEWQAAQAAVEALAEGEGALTIKEAQARLAASEKKVARLTAELKTLTPLFEKGFITREELSRPADALEVAESELALDRQRASILVDRTHPREEQRAKLQLAQRAAQRENVRTRALEVEARVKLLREQIEGCSIYAKRPGLVVLEEYLAANPRRKIRVGDRVTASQTIITIPEVNRMLLQALVNEGDVHKLQVGQPAAIRLEAFPALRITGKVVGVGTVANSNSDRPREDKRFDLIVELDSADPGIRPQMTARADIDLGERPNVLLIPVNAVFEHDGLPVAHVSHRWSTDTRPVQLGESNGLYVEVVSGLNEGDRVRLDDVAVQGSGGGDSAGGKALSPMPVGKKRDPLSPR